MKIEDLKDKKKRRHSSKQFKSFIRQRAIPFEERVEAEWQAIKKKEEEIFNLLEEESRTKPGSIVSASEFFMNYRNLEMDKQF